MAKRISDVTKRTANKKENEKSEEKSQEKTREALALLWSNAV
ncbi:hypothetical protein [Dickeya zeae]|nr:hypothetical protein [Dickeya zeae]